MPSLRRSAKHCFTRLPLGVPILVATCLMLARMPNASAIEGQWPKFQNGGLSSIDTALPTEWSPEQNIAWTADIKGYGQSTPIVAHDQIVVTSTSGENKDDYHVSSFAIDTGELNWQVDVANPSPFKNSPMVVLRGF